MDKSRSYLTHDKHQDLFDSLLNSIMLDEAIERGDANPNKVLRKRDHGDDEDKNPSAAQTKGRMWYILYHNTESILGLG
ncbi:hypothetical protein Tco_0185590 [Tanacetum coccineum]